MADDRSRKDVLSMGAGAVFLAIALVVLLGGGHAFVDRSGWLIPLLLVGLGLLGIRAGTRAGRPDR